MKPFDAELRKLFSKEELQVPVSVHEKTEQTLASLPLQAPKRRLYPIRKMTAAAACTAVLLLGIMPNLSMAYAQSAGQIPVIGPLIQVFTIRNYAYSDGHHELNASIPAISDPYHSQAGSSINKDIDELTSDVIHEFYHNLEVSSGQGYGSVSISYEIITNSSRWFTLKLTVTEISGSSGVYDKYYHIDRTTGKYVTFADMFPQDAYHVLEKEIINQMAVQMSQDENAIYWTENISEHFAALDGDQNFYFEPDGDLVIVYDKYEVGPGYMGCPEFKLSPEQYGRYIGSHYAELFLPQ